MENFQDVKIVKKCKKREEVEVPKVQECKDFDFNEGCFLKTIDAEILFIDDSIILKNEENKENISQKSQDIHEDDAKKPRKTPPICFANVPKPLNEQISLPIDDIKDISFYETFIIAKKPEDADKLNDIAFDINDASEIGSACLMVEEMSDGNILIFSIQQIFINDKSTLSECLSVVTKDLKLIHEKRIERKCSDGMIMENSIFILPNVNGYRLVKSTSIDGDTESLKADVEWTKCGDFLCHGANVLMTRKLVSDFFKGCVQCYTCDIEGEFALTQYWFHDTEMDYSYDCAILARRVDKLIVYDDQKFEKVSSFFMAQTGQLLRQVCDNQEHFIFRNPLEDPYEQKDTGKLQENWQSDVQLMEMYLEHKAKRKEELKKKFESPQMKFLLNKYIDNLIKCKPKSIMNFTVEFMRKLERSSNVNAQLQIFQTAERRNQQN